MSCPHSTASTEAAAICLQARAQANPGNESRGLADGKDSRCPPGATIRRHKPEMSRVTNAVQSAFLCISVLLLSSCSSVHVGDLMPHAIGGLPADAPPRRGTPEYHACMAKRAEIPPRSASSEPGSQGNIANLQRCGIVQNRKILVDQLWWSEAWVPETNNRP